jgi:methionyl-tRNA formyltransferase
MGTSAFSLPSLRRLRERHDLKLVVTQPDRPSGRGRRLAPSPVKEEATALALPVVQPERLGAGEIAAILAEGPEVIVVAAYGKLLPPALLFGPRLGCVNVHASLLPRYRGAAPIVWAIARGERETGVTLMRMDAGMDTGPILLQRSVPIADDDTAGTLEPRLAELGADLLIDGLARLERGGMEARTQDESLATRAPRLHKEDAHLDFTLPARRVCDLVRAMDPRPGAFCLLAGEPLHVFRGRPAEGAGEPGTVVSTDGDLVIACGGGAVAFGELQLPGRRRLPAGDVLRGRSIPSGTRLS